jgi:hypothetical protein
VAVRLEPVSFTAVVKFLISNAIAPGSVLRVLIRQDERNSKKETKCPNKIP